MSEAFEQEFNALMAKRRSSMKEAFDRTLPSGELIYNRFDKAKDLGFGEGSSVYDASCVFGDVRVGKNVWIGPYTILDGSAAELVIGDYVSIDSGVMIYTHDSTKHYISGGKVPFEKGKVEIGDCTVIGSMSTVMCGTVIGSHCIIGAHSHIGVGMRVPDYSIAAGCPAKIIGKVIDDPVEGIRLEYFSARDLRKEV